MTLQGKNKKIKSNQANPNKSRRNGKGYNTYMAWIGYSGIKIKRKRIKWKTGREGWTQPDPIHFGMLWIAIVAIPNLLFHRS